MGEKPSYKSNVILSDTQIGKEICFNSLESACSFLGICNGHLIYCSKIHRPVNGYEITIIRGRKKPTMKRLVDNVENLPGEIWRPVMVFNGYFKDAYEISNLGRLKNFYSRKNILVKPYGEERLYVGLNFEGISKGYLLAYLVLMTFNPTEIEDRNQIIYLDGNVQNVAVSNLKWTKQKYDILDGEIWKLIPGCDDYYVSNLGRVRKGLWLLTPRSNTEDGYLGLAIQYANNDWKSENVARLVAKTFLSKEKYDKAIWDELTVNHMDGNKQNNHLSNLEWCTIKENIQHAYRTGLNSRVHPIYMEFNDFVFIFYMTTEIPDMIEDFRELTHCQLCGYINSNYRYKGKYLLFDDDYIPFVSQIPDLEGEIWKEVKDFPGEYLVSNKGRVKHICKNSVESLLKSPTSIEATVKKNIYQVLAETFFDIEFKYVYARDGNYKNYSLDNLMFNKIENLDGEEWRKISTIWFNKDVSNKDFKKLSEYEISSYGRVRYIIKRKMMVSYGHEKRGNYTFRAILSGKEYGLYVSRLMCLTFKPIKFCKTYDDYSNYKVIHIDGDGKNNHLSNLQWISAKKGVPDVI